MFSDFLKKKILWNYYFELFGDEINNINKTHYSDFHTYTETKSVFILSEEQKSIKMNKISETNKSEDNSYVASKSGNNNNK